jgi:hypothetical protein
MVDLIDETFIVAEPARIADALHEPALWRRLWPGLELVIFQDRGRDGLRFTVTGELVGTNEFWVEPYADGAVVHYYCRCDVTRRGSATEPVRGPARQLLRVSLRALRQHAIATKAGLNRLKDELEGGRRPGTPRVPGPDQDGSVTPDG